jgi:hypothetical protein
MRLHVAAHCVPLTCDRHERKVRMHSFARSRARGSRYSSPPRRGREPPLSLTHRHAAPLSGLTAGWQRHCRAFAAFGRTARPGPWVVGGAGRMYLGIERRATARYLEPKTGAIDLGPDHHIKCTVRDFSTGRRAQTDRAAPSLMSSHRRFIALSRPRRESNRSYLQTHAVELSPDRSAATRVSTEDQIELCQRNAASCG